MRSCPRCGADQVRPSHRRGAERWLAVAWLRPYRCRRCRRRFWGSLPGPLTVRERRVLTAAGVAVAVFLLAALYLLLLPYGREVAEVGAVAPPASEPATEATAAAPAPPPGRLFGGVDAEPFDGGVRIVLRTGTPPASWASAFLADPPRYAVEIPGRWRLPGTAAPLELDHPLVRTVRVDRHPDLLRAVLVLGSLRGPEPEIEPTRDGLVVTLRTPAE